MVNGGVTFISPFSCLLTLRSLYSTDFFFYKYISPSLLCKYTLQHCKKDILFRFLFEVCFV